LHTYRVPRFLRERDQVELFHQGEEDSSGPELVGKQRKRMSYLKIRCTVYVYNMRYSYLPLLQTIVIFNYLFVHVLHFAGFFFIVIPVPLSIGFIRFDSATFS
jgi:hypothetical protein